MYCILVPCPLIVENRERNPIKVKVGVIVAVGSKKSYKKLTVITYRFI